MSEWRSGRSTFGAISTVLSKAPAGNASKEVTSSAPANERAWCFTFGPKGTYGGCDKLWHTSRPRRSIDAFNQLEALPGHQLGVSYRDFLAYLSPSQAAAADALVNSFREQFKRAAKQGAGVKRIFTRYDPRGVGSVDGSSFKACLRELKVRASDDEVDQLLDHFNLDYANDFSLSRANRSTTSNHAAQEDKNARVRYEAFTRYMLSAPVYATTIATQTQAGPSRSDNLSGNMPARWEPRVSLRRSASARMGTISNAYATCGFRPARRRQGQPNALVNASFK